MSEEKFIDGQFKITMLLTKERSIEASFNVSTSDTAETLNAKIDKYQDAITRQFVRLDLVSKEAQVEQAKQSLEDLVEQYDGLKTLKAEGGHLASTKKQQMANHEQTLKAIRKNIASLQSAIKAGRDKLNGAAPHG